MQRSPTARLLWACTAALAITLAAHRAGMAQEEQVSICHSTGSAANPWVFMTIDPRTWSEHQAHGDFRATSLADCSPPTPAPTGLLAQAQPVQQQPQPAAPSTPIPSPTSAPPSPISTPVRSAEPVATPAPTIETAGVRAREADPERASDVSSLPKGGGEPDRPLLVVALLVIAAVGVSLRRLARSMDPPAAHRW